MVFPTTARRLAFLSAPGFAVAVFVLFLLDLQIVYEPPWLLPILNTVLLSGALCAVAYLAGCGYQASGSLHLLFFGNAALAYAIGSLISGWVVGARGSMDAAVTLHHVAAAISGALYLTSGLLVMSEGRVPASGRSRRWLPLATSVGMLASLLFLTAISLRGATPPFFTSGVGFTPLRHVTLGIAVTGFAVSTLLSSVRYRAVRSDFLYWSASALALFAVGLGALFFQRMVGSPVGWLGRASQYVGSVYFLIGAVHAVREIRHRRLPVEWAITALFREARENYEALVEAVADPIVAFDAEGRVLLWNAAAEHMFGYRDEDAIGAPLLDLVGFHGEAAEWASGSRFRTDAGTDPGAGTRLQTKVRSADGRVVPVEISLSGRRGRGGFVGTMILRDITERQRAMDRLQQLNRDLRIISLCNQALVRARDEAELLRETCRIIVEEGKNRVAWVGFRGDTGEIVRPVAVVGCDPERLDRHTMDLADTAWATCPVTVALRDGSPQVVRDIPGGGPRCPWHHEALRLGLGSSLSLPLAWNGHSFGVLTIYSALPDAFDAEEITLFDELANDLAYGVQAIRTRVDHERSRAEIESLARFPGENPRPVLRVRDDGVILYANPPSAQLLRLWGAAAGGPMPAEWIARIRQTLETRTQEALDVPCEDRVYSIVLAPVPEERYVNFYGRDITDHVRAKEALRDGEALFRAVLDSLPIGVAVNSVDPAVEFDYMNDNFPAVYRSTRDALSRPDAFWDTVYEEPSFREEIKARVLEDCASGDPQRMQWDDIPIVRRADRRTYYVSARNIPVPGKRLMVSAVWDITQRKQTEEALRRNEALLRMAGRTARLGAWSVDVPPARVVWSDEVAAIHEMPAGYSPAMEEAIGFYAPEWREKIADIFDTCVREGTPYDEEMEILTSRGRRVWVRTIGEAIRGTSGTVIRVQGAFQDITDRKRLEAERAQLEAQLRQQQKLEALGTLAGGVAHEINNPIAGIMNYAQLIADTVPTAHPAAGYAQEIVQETTRVATIVRNLLQFARQEKQSHSPASIADIIERTVSLVRAVLRRDQIALAVDVPEGMPPLRCRSQQLQQVLMNLLTNARDALNAKYPGYDPDKTIAVTVRPFEQDGGAWLRLTVADHGPGIPPTIQARIFDPFFTTKPRDQGTGLGLAISHGIVKDHGGRLTFETTPGKGTAFHVELRVDGAPRVANT